jgi:uncharacterized membrane protein (DUF4010 family)
MAGVNAWLGDSDLIAATVLAGFADPHSAAISVASKVESNKLGVRESALPILVVLTANTVTKIVIAISGGGRRFGSIVARQRTLASSRNTSLPKNSSLPVRSQRDSRQNASPKLLINP